MHESTYRYLVDNIDKMNLGRMAYISGDVLKFNGTKIVISNHIPATRRIETGRWIFPRTPFIIYEQSDMDYCRWAGIGEPETKLVVGEIYGMGEPSSPIIPQHSPSNRSRIFDPNDYSIPVRKQQLRGIDMDHYRGFY